MNNLSPQKCPVCAGNVVLKQGTSQAGKPYKFYGCDNFPDCTYIWRKPKAPAVPIARKQDAIQLLRDIKQSQEDIKEMVSSLEAEIVNLRGELGGTTRETLNEEEQKAAEEVDTSDII